MRRIVFLDIDGVLNSGRYFLSLGARNDGLHLPPFEEQQLDPEAVARLQRVLDATGAEAIVSSSWRLAYKLERLQSVLGARGLKSRLAGVTPNLMTDYRREEIALWLERHGLGVERFVILDDDPLAGVDFEDCFVLTTFQDGLTTAHAERAIALLNAPPVVDAALADTERPPSPPPMTVAPSAPPSASLAPTSTEMPETCCKNIGRRQFRACGEPAKHWYQHGDDVCSYCDRHDYRCGERLAPKFFSKFT